MRRLGAASALLRLTAAAPAESRVPKLSYGIRRRPSRSLPQRAVVAARSRSRADRPVLRRRAARPAGRSAGALVTERGFESFLDYYYLLKYDAAAAAEWHRVMDALCVPETYFWREIDQMQAIADVIVPGLVARAAEPPDPDLERAVRHRRGAADASRWCSTKAGWFDRAESRSHASDASPAAIERARRRPLPRAVVPRAAAGAARAVLRASRRRVATSIRRLHARVRSWSVVNLMSRARSRRWREADRDLLPQRVHLFLAGRGRARRRHVRRRACRRRAICASARRSRCCA